MKINSLILYNVTRVQIIIKIIKLDLLIFIKAVNGMFTFNRRIWVGSLEWTKKPLRYGSNIPCKNKTITQKFFFIYQYHYKHIEHTCKLKCNTKRHSLMYWWHEHPPFIKPMHVLCSYDYSKTSTNVLTKLARSDRKIFGFLPIFNDLTILCL